MILPPPQSKPDKTPEELAAEVSRLTELVKVKDRLLQLKDEVIRLLNFKLFGPKTEKLSPNQTLLLLDEASVSAGEVRAEAQLPAAQKESPLPKARQPRPNHPGREKLPEHLERREEIIPCHHYHPVACT